MNTLDVEDILEQLVSKLAILFLALGATWYGVRLYNKGKIDAVIAIAEKEVTIK